MILMRCALQRNSPANASEGIMGFKSPSFMGEGETLNGVKGGDEAEFTQDYAT